MTRVPSNFQQQYTLMEFSTVTPTPGHMPAGRGGRLDFTVNPEGTSQPYVRLDYSPGAWGWTALRLPFTMAEDAVPTGTPGVFQPVGLPLQGQTSTPPRVHTHLHPGHPVYVHLSEARLLWERMCRPGAIFVGRDWRLVGPSELWELCNKQG